MRLECDFPVIGGQQGSLLGLSRVHGEQDGAAGLSLPPEGREGPQLLHLGGTSSSQGVQHVELWSSWEMGFSGSGARGLEGSD